MQVYIYSVHIKTFSDMAVLEFVIKLLQIFFVDIVKVLKLRVQ